MGTHAVFEMLLGSTASRPACSLLHNVKITRKSENDFRSFLLSFLHPAASRTEDQEMSEHLAQKSLLRCHAMAAAGRARAAIIGHACHDRFHPVLKSDVNLWRYICAGYAGFMGIIARCPPHARSLAPLIRVSSRVGAGSPKF